MTRRQLLAAIGAATLTAGADPARRRLPSLDVEPGRYREAPATASVAGRAYQERPRPEAPDVPLAGASIVLLPRSDSLLGRLTALKTGARDSIASYRRAAPAMRETREDFERALHGADAGGLVRAASVDAAGRFQFDAVPAGEWLLLAWHALFVDTPSRGTTRRVDRPYTLDAALEGYRAVSVWLREISLRAGAREAVELTDRNVWFSGVEEVKRAGGH